MRWIQIQQLFRNIGNNLQLLLVLGEEKHEILQTLFDHVDVAFYQILTFVFVLHSHGSQSGQEKFVFHCLNRNVGSLNLLWFRALFNLFFLFVGGELHFFHLDLLKLLSLPSLLELSLTIIFIFLVILEGVIGRWSYLVAFINSC